MELSQLTQYIPFLIPLALIQIGLMLTALIHVLRHKTYRFGSRAMWVVIVVCVQTIGPILYLTVGRGQGDE